MEWQQTLAESGVAIGHELSLNKIVPDAVFQTIKRALKVFRPKWLGGNTQAFKLALPAQECLDFLLNVDVMPQGNPYSYHPTPKDVRDVIFEETAADPQRWAFYDRPIEICEPSCGEGALADEICKAFDEAGIKYNLTVIEMDPINCISLRQKGYNPHNINFFDYVPDREFDLFVINPPFEFLGFIKHIRHAQKMLAEKGKLVAVIPSNPISFSRFKPISEALALDAALTLDDPFIFDAGTFVTAKTIETRVIELRHETEMKRRVSDQLKEYIEHEFTITYENCGDTRHALQALKNETNDSIRLVSVKSILRPFYESLIDNNKYITNDWFEAFCRKANNLLSTVADIAKPFRYKEPVTLTPAKKVKPKQVKAIQISVNSKPKVSASNAIFKSIGDILSVTKLENSLQT
jgi:hypothetical protein